MVKKKDNLSLYIYYTILILITIIILLIIYFIFIQFYKTLFFKSCQNCDENKYYYINVQNPDQDIINDLYIKFKERSINLNPKYNFNNSKGKKLNYNQLSINIKKFYLNKKLLNDSSNTLKEKLYFSNESDKYKIFARLYDNENDFIDWHYDNNHTDGKRYTLVIPLVVSPGNTSEFMIKDRKTNKEKIINIPIGKGIIYDGTITYHKISKQTKGQSRMVVIIPLYTNNKISKVNNIKEKIRNNIYNTLKI